MAGRILATYLIESPLPVQAAAEALAGERSTDTSLPAPSETAELRERFRPRVEGVTSLGTVEAPGLPDALPARDGRYYRGQAVLSFPFETVGANLPALLSAVAGSVFELRELSGIRLLDLDLPEEFARAYGGPRFGVDGTRDLAGVYGRPLIGTIVKPSMGLTPEATAQLVRTLAGAGIDFVKDDALTANPPHAPLERRVEEVMRVVNDAADRTGKKVMYAFNITDDLDAMLRHHDTVLRAGGTCIMVSLDSVGLAGLPVLRRHSELPVHGHRNGLGALTRSPSLGFSFTAMQKLWRLAGVDHLHVDGLRNTLFESADSVVASIDACLAPMYGGMRAMPAISSNQWGEQAPETYRRTQTLDLIYVATDGVMAHPGGPSSGVRALRQAWEAAARGIPLKTYAEDRRELRQTIERFGPKPAAGGAQGR